MDFYNAVTSRNSVLFIFSWTSSQCVDYVREVSIWIRCLLDTWNLLKNTKAQLLFEPSFYVDKYSTHTDVKGDTGEDILRLLVNEEACQLELNRQILDAEGRKGERGGERVGGRGRLRWRGRGSVRGIGGHEGWGRRSSLHSWLYSIPCQLVYNELALILVKHWPV